MIRHRIAAFFTCAFLFVPSVGTLAATQDEVDNAKLQQQLAEARKATAEAEAAEARAKLGTLDTSKLTKPSGEAKGLTVEGTLLAYAAVDRIAEVVATKVQAVVGASPVVIYSEKEINALIQSRAFLKNLQMLDSAMGRIVVPELAADNDKCTEPKSGGAGLGVLGSIDVALQVLSLFKVDKKLEGADVTVDSFALASAVLAKLREKGVTTTIYPALYLAGAFDAPPNDAFSKSEIVRLLDGLDLRQAQMDAKLADITRRREKIKARAEDATNKPTAACKAAFAEAQTIYDNLEIRIKAAKVRADKYTTVATTVDEKTGVTLLQFLVQSEQMSKMLPGAYVLQLKPIAAGGTTLTKTSLLTTNFRFSGGAIVSYMLVSGSQGAIAASGTIAEYGGYAKPEDLGSVMQQKQDARRQ